MKTTYKAQADHCHVGQDCHPYFVVFGFSLDLHTEVQQNKYCSVVVKLKEYFYVDYRFENYLKNPSRPYVR